MNKILILLLITLVLSLSVVSAACSETDGGKNFFSTGSAVGLNATDGSLIIVNDYCNPSTLWLTEAYCNGDYVEFENYKCEACNEDDTACEGEEPEETVPECTSNDDCQTGYECIENTCVEEVVEEETIVEEEEIPEEEPIVEAEEVVEEEPIVEAEEVVEEEPIAEEEEIVEIVEEEPSERIVAKETKELCFDGFDNDKDGGIDMYGACKNLKEHIKCEASSVRACKRFCRENGFTYVSPDSGCKSIAEETQLRRAPGQGFLCGWLGWLPWC